jgi:membrane-associated phospholipid phosphatase
MGTRQDGEPVTESDTATPLFGSWLAERWMGTICLFAVYSSYFPLTDYTQTLQPVDMSTAFDAGIPLSPIWIVFYVMIYPAAILPMFVVKDPLVFRNVIKAFLAVELIAIAIFVIVPVHMSLRPPLEAVPEGGFFEWGIRICYWYDFPTCCFPSLHVATATLSGLACYRVHRPTGYVAIFIALMISLSTMLVKQHFVADVIAGMALSGVFYFLWVRNAKPLDASQLSHSRWWLCVPCVFYVSIITGFYLNYADGFQPWAQ